MTQSEHQRAREFLVTGDSARPEQRAWLQAHLQACAECREYEMAAGQVVRALRSQPLAAGSSLVGRTQMRVRLRAQELRQQQERMWLVCICCVFVGLSAAVTTSFFWRAFAWAGSWAGVEDWVWKAGFAFFWIVPALVVSALLVARGTHLAHDGDGSWR
jgi:predicted anti-sigma-YlaC factor YlaD